MRLMSGGHHQCLLYAAAMVLDVEPSTLIEEIGHDGLEKWWPDRQPPLCYRGFHPQEITECFLRRGLSLTRIELNPVSGHSLKEAQAIYPMKEINMRFNKLIENKEAILIGHNHAVAWNGKIIYDPNGKCYDLRNFYAKEAWIKG